MKGDPTFVVGLFESPRSAPWPFGRVTVDPERLVVRSWPRGRWVSFEVDHRSACYKVVRSNWALSTLSIDGRPGLGVWAPLGLSPIVRALRSRGLQVATDP